MKASRSGGLVPSSADCTRVIISSEYAACSGVATRVSAITFSSVSASSGCWNWSSGSSLARTFCFRADCSTGSGGNHRRLHCGERLLKRHSRLRPCIRNPPPPTPFVRRAQDILVLRDLLHQVVKRSFHCRRWRTCGLLDRHLSRGKPQVERNNISLARRVLLDYTLQVYQFGTEDL